MKALFLMSLFIFYIPKSFKINNINSSPVFIYKLHSLITGHSHRHLLGFVNNSGLTLWVRGYWWREIVLMTDI